MLPLSGMRDYWNRASVVKGHGATQNGSSERSSLAEAPPLLPSLDRNKRSSLFCAYTAALHLPAKRRKGAQLPRPIKIHGGRDG